MNARRRFHLVVRLCALGAPVFVAACLGGRGTKRPAPAVTPATVSDTVRQPVVVPVVRDSANPPVVKLDSAVRTADSARKAVAALDSAAGKKPVAKKPPAKQCILNTDESPPESRFTLNRPTDSSSVLLIGGGFVGYCEGEKNRLKADSAEYYELNGFVNLFGNVTYEDKGEFRVTANHALYFVQEGRLQADGNVIALQLKSGSAFSGPNVDYFAVKEGVRETSRLYAPNNPTVQIKQKDSTGTELPPVRINSSVMQDTGDSTLVAWGSVIINRTDIVGRSDSANYNKTSGTARLIRQATIESTSKDQAFTLTGDTIDLFTHDEVLDRVLAKHLAKAKSGEVNMGAEFLDLRLIDRKIDRAFAYGPGRAKADTKSQTLEADSMDIVLPNQRIRELRAFGRAIAISKPDTLKISSEENDVLKGDSVLAQFDSLVNPADTSAKAEIRRVVAMGNASSLVQIASRQGPTFPPAINYIRGRYLVVQFDSGQVKEVAVDSSASGAYYEPVRDSTVDSTGKTRKPRRPPGLAVLKSRSLPLPAPTRHPAPFVSSASFAILPTRTQRLR